ncbi:MAG TPA: HAD hydrolase family protein [Opitutales bacterium]|jgi:3-deoxy-D-manno-octulosonate 8-phosphate phosphatase (KDO 8-P phosphatase)|nr:HAD hydrolase family protein [Opitutales bacterium]
MVKQIKLLALDIDGVLTDGRTTLGARKPEKKRLAFQDLDAINAAKRAGLLVALVTGESDGSVDLVVQRTGVTLFRRGAKDKLAALQSIARELRISLAEICYVGDGNRDAPALARVGLAFAPANGTFAAKQAAHRVVEKFGGNGVVDEVVRLLHITHSGPLFKKIIRPHLRVEFQKHKIPLRLLPVAVNLAEMLTQTYLMGGKLFLLGEGAELALEQMLASPPAWTAIALSPHRASRQKQLQVLPRPGDWVICFPGSGSRQKFTLANASGKKILALPHDQAAPIWRAIMKTA